MKTTLMVDDDIYKAAKRMAVERDTTMSSMLTKSLLLYVSDPEGVEETASILTDRKAMAALLEGIEARAKKRKGYYMDWTKVREL
jgi:hypothetical protein